jgi:hypothetical protein
MEGGELCRGELVEDYGGGFCSRLVEWGGRGAVNEMMRSCYPGLGARGFLQWLSI